MLPLNFPERVIRPCRRLEKALKKEVPMSANNCNQQKSFIIRLNLSKITKPAVSTESTSGAVSSHTRPGDVSMTRTTKRKFDDDTMSPELSSGCSSPKRTNFHDFLSYIIFAKAFARHPHLNFPNNARRHPRRRGETVNTTDVKKNCSVQMYRPFWMPQQALIYTTYGSHFLICGYT